MVPVVVWEASTTGTRPEGGEGAYLIVLRHVVVAQDIALTLSDHDPGAPVLLATATTEALRLLEGAPCLRVAFVAEAPALFAGSSLEAAIAARGGRPVLIGEAAEADPMGFAVLLRPFTTAAVLVHLRA